MSPRQSKIVYKEFISVCYITKRSHYTNLNRYGQIVPDLKASSCITCVNASSIDHDILPVKPFCVTRILYGHHLSCTRYSIILKHIHKLTYTSDIRITQYDVMYTLHNITN